MIYLIGLLIWLLPAAIVVIAAGVCLLKPRNDISHNELDQYCKDKNP